MIPIEILIREKIDVVLARQEARDVARRVGFSPIDQAKIATAISELAEYIVHNIQNGVVTKGAVTITEIIRATGQRGIEINIRGLDLPPAAMPALATIGRLIDNLEVSQREDAPVIVLKKWLTL